MTFGWVGLCDREVIECLVHEQHEVGWLTGKQSCLVVISSRRRSIRWNDFLVVTELSMKQMFDKH